MSENPNPQGKGLSPILATLEESRAAAAAVPPKHIEQVSTELFTSLFVLESDFRFKPTPGRSYWLYHKRGRFWLSLIPPGEWDETDYGRYIGECSLQPDMTWTLLLADEVARWWIPERWSFVSEVPKTSVGKYDKKLLRSRHEQGELDVRTNR